MTRKTDHAKRLHRSSYELTGEVSEYQLARWVAEALDDKLDPATTTWFSISNTPLSRRMAVIQRAIGVKAGTPDLVVLQRGLQPVFVELKKPGGGRLSSAQIEIRSKLLTAGAIWFWARSTAAVLTGLREAGVRFRHDWEPSASYSPEAEGPFYSE